MKAGNKEETGSDVLFEDAVQSNKYSLKIWLRYLEHKKTSRFDSRKAIFERALQVFPGSYKLWHAYLSEKTRIARELVHKIGLADERTKRVLENVNSTFERSLASMNKMPVIWLMYLQFLADQKVITKVRKTFDRALQALAITQHERVWSWMLNWLKNSPFVPTETALRLWRRYMQISPSSAEDFVDFLELSERWEEAGRLLTDILSHQGFTSQKGQSRHQLWLRLCDIISQHPECSRGLRVEAILRQGLSSFKDQTGRLWTALASFFIRNGNYEKARDVLEEALGSVTSEQDFAHIWDVYADFEDRLLADYIAFRSNSSASSEEKEEEEREFALRVERYKYLLDRRPLLLSSVKLRRNPHNVKEWMKRVKLYSNARAVVDTYSRAIRTVDPLIATGKPHLLWAQFAAFYGQQGDDENARKIFERGTEAVFRTSAELASMWAEYIEFELKRGDFDRARSLLARALRVPSPSSFGALKESDWAMSIPAVRQQGLAALSSSQLQAHQRWVAAHLHRSTPLWCLRADVEESVGTADQAKAVYDKILELKIASPLVIINYADLLQRQSYFEESFKIYERGVSMFKFPHAMDVWICYLTQFVERYRDSKLERARDLFEQAIQAAPPSTSKIFYIMYADLEERYGLARHAMNIYDRATRAVDDSDKFVLFNLYISRATEFFGVTRTRDIYEKALHSLPDRFVKDICLQYAELELKLGEIDRARAIYTYCCQFCDPRSHPNFWTVWNDFEIRHGNPETYREMLRLKRSVQARYNTQVNFMASQMFVPAKSTPQIISNFSDLEKSKALLPAPVTGKRPREDLYTVSDQEPVVSSNPEEMQLDDEDDDDNGSNFDGDSSSSSSAAAAEKIVLEQIPVPESVFNSAKPMGALERLRRSKSTQQQQ